ncbi:MAG: tyrosine--tRNA ligase [Chloroflexi bacterium B3_Chlor]|nr:MAG: tyrosine--tRNA ligase [Chloroflexi bacterium B3_Chlor]
MKPVDDQMPILMQGVEFGDPQTQETMEAALRERLAEGRPLRVYCGYDPTSPDLHLGHTITMRKLRQFQDLGHDAIFLIGDFTGLVGDPSDRESARRQQTPEQVAEKAETYLQQAFKILDPDKTIVRRNSEWLSKLSFIDVIELASHFTVQQFLARENFSRRYDKGDPVWLHEFLYALMQGRDAAAMETDVQLGGTDQLFNLLVGRKLQEIFGQRPQICLTFPILVGTDGYLRMSKSTGNYIGIDEPAEEMYGKVMSLPDHAMLDYYTLVTRFTPDQIASINQGLGDGSLHPRDVKMQLAREIVSIFHGDEAASEAEHHFRTVFQERELPPEMPIYALEGPTNVVEVITASGLAKSKSEARRLIQQGGVRLNGEKVESIEAVVTVEKEAVLQVGKRKFTRLVAASAREGS